MTNQINKQSIIPSTEVIQLTLTLKTTTAQVIETSVTVNNSPIQDYVHPDDQTQPTFEMTPGFKPFTENIQEFRSDGAWNVSFGTRLMPAYKVTKVAGTRNHSRTRGLQTELSFFMMQARIFGKVQMLSVCYKLVKCYGNSPDKFQLTTLLLR